LPSRSRRKKCLRSGPEQIKCARFVGMRRADACIVIVKEHKKVTHTGMLSALNNGMFRFRTSAPLREIHGAMVRQPFVSACRTDGCGPDPIAAAEKAAQPALRLVARRAGRRTERVVSELVLGEAVTPR